MTSLSCCCDLLRLGNVGRCHFTQALVDEHTRLVFNPLLHTQPVQLITDLNPNNMIYFACTLLLWIWNIKKIFAVFYEQRCIWLLQCTINFVAFWIKYLQFYYQQMNKPSHCVTDGYPLFIILNIILNIKSVHTATASSLRTLTCLIVGISHSAEERRQVWRCVTMISAKRRNNRLESLRRHCVI